MFQLTSDLTVHNVGSTLHIFRFFGAHSHKLNFSV